MLSDDLPEKYEEEGKHLKSKTATMNNPEGFKTALTRKIKIKIESTTVLLDNIFAL